VVNTFHSAEAFLQSNEIEETSCLITDVRLPGMSGFQLKTELARNGFDVPTIFVTAYPCEPIPACAQGSQPACLLTKPVREKELLARIDQIRDRTAE
jgi:FixJ family two-component response regulator